jgi:thiamine biosynthesis protein ThiI
MGVVLKRMFVRAASMVAQKYGIEALITGEALGQVSSQTLTNLRMIDLVSDTLILRPLITWDKEDIIDLSRKIGTEAFARHIPEYCGVISKSPTVKAKRSVLEFEESKFDFAILEQVADNAVILDIRDLIADEPKIIQPLDIIDQLPLEQQNSWCILDISKPDEVESKTLLFGDFEVVLLPFYQLSSKFEQLDQNKTYLLYCAQGVMSRLQALDLIEKGFTNVKVFRPTNIG